MRRETFALLATMGLLLAVGLLLVGYQLAQWRRPTLESWERISPGLSETEVRGLLGKPHREYDEGAPADYYVSGYARKERRISGKVLIYMGADLVLYVWIDKQGKVEEVFRGGS